MILSNVKYLYFIIAIFLLSCEISKKDKIPDVCFDDTKSVEIEKITFNDLYNLKDLNGKVVEIQGVFHYFFEDVAVYKTKSSHSENALWIHFIDKIAEVENILSKMNKKKVTIRGTLDLSKKGHLGYYLGTLNKVSCIKVD